MIFVLLFRYSRMALARQVIARSARWPSIHLLRVSFDKSAHQKPSLALANAARETLHISTRVEVMLKQVMTALMTNNRALVGEVSRMDNIIN